MAKGAFNIKDGPGNDRLNFNLEPDRSVPDPIPDDQRDLQHDVYAAAGVLKQLYEQGAFSRRVLKRPTWHSPWIFANQGGQDTAYDEFRERLRQAAEVGLEGENVKTRLASSAVEQIAGEVVTRVGKHLQIRYLTWLLLGVLVGCLAGVAMHRNGWFPGYGVVLAASMVGAWISAVALRGKVELTDLPQFLNSKLEPVIRLMFVGFVACAVALFVKVGLLPITVGDLKLAEFPSNPEAAAVLGLVAGISEKTISVRLIQKARQAIPSPMK